MVGFLLNLGRKQYVSAWLKKPCRPNRCAPEYIAEIAGSRNKERRAESMREVFTIVAIPNGEKHRWVKVGAAFDSEKGTTVILNALPVNGKLFIKHPNTTESN